MGYFTCFSSKKCHHVSPKFSNVRETCKFLVKKKIHQPVQSPQDSAKWLWWVFFAEEKNFGRKLHHKCLNCFWMRLWYSPERIFWVSPLMKVLFQEMCLQPYYENTITGDFPGTFQNVQNSNFSKIYATFSDFTRNHFYVSTFLVPLFNFFCTSTSKFTKFCTFFGILWWRIISWSWNRKYFHFKSFYFMR